MTTPTYTPTDLVKFALGKDAVNVTAAFDQMIGQRVYDAIQARKIEVAKSMFGQQPEEEQAAEDKTVGSEEQNNNEEESEESHENAEQSA